MRHMMRVRSSNFSVFSILLRNHCISSISSCVVVKPVTATIFNSSPSTTNTFSAMDLHFKFCRLLLLFQTQNYEDDETHFKGLSLEDEGVARDTTTIVDILRELGSSPSETKYKLDHCGISASSELVVGVLSRFRNDWEAAFTFFLWAGKQPGYAYSVREYHSMISILGKMRKFDTAWALINEMKGGTTGPSLMTPQTLLIMIRRYCAVHNVGRAINTFYAFKRYKFEVGINEFQGLLSALCRPREGERIWREMSKRGVQHDVFSYGSLISCYSKACNLNKVLKLFNRMKEMNIAPDRKVYNAVIHALAKGRLVKEATNVMKTMDEKGVTPNIVTYNSLIKPLCRARQIEEAREVFDKMLRQGLSPTIRTYHAFLRTLRTGEEVFVLLETMKKMGCQPNTDTYIMLIRKFCRWRQLDNVFKLWSEMSQNGVNPDRSSYIVLIHGLFLNGKLEEAHKYYIEMKEKQLMPEPKTEKMLQAWLSSKYTSECQMTDLECNQLNCSQSGKNSRVISRRVDQVRDFCRQPETRRVVRDRGFSFLDQ
ncbi:hypothetical protein SLA2020_495570 [Shorea laevis]